MTTWHLWAVFIAFVTALIAFDLLVLNRKAHVISTKEAFRWTALWASVALAFSVAVYFIYEHKFAGMGINVPQLAGEPRDVAGLEALKIYITGYIVELSLSLDNMFVIALIFAYFKVPAMYQHRVLFWGILGAIIMRGVMILIGAIAIQKLHWINYVFGAVLLLSALKMLRHSESDDDLNSKWIVRTAKKIMPLHPVYEGERFLLRIDGRLFMTPLMLVLLMVESADLMFAVDSIPAIFAITADPFIVFTSNVFAIMGLRSLYFALAGMMRKFRYIKYSLVLLLAYIGVKMMLMHFVKIPTEVSLTIILLLLGGGIAVSIIADRRAPPQREIEP